MNFIDIKMHGTMIKIICHVFMLTGCWQDQNGTQSNSILPAASQHKHMTYTSCCIYTVVPPDDEQ